MRTLTRSVTIGILIFSCGDEATEPVGPEFCTQPDTDGGWVNRCVNVSGGVFPLLG